MKRQVKIIWNIRPKKLKSFLKSDETSITVKFICCIQDLSLRSK